MAAAALRASTTAGLAVHGVNERTATGGVPGRLALKARDNGQSEYADELTQLASEAFDQAADMERRLVSDPKTPLP